MQKVILSNIHNDTRGYNQLIKLYEEHKEDIFEDIELDLTSWFDANLSAVLGAILDKIKQDGLKNIQFGNIKSDIQKILQKNNFLSFYGFDRLHDTFHTTIEYKKLKPTDTRYFNAYLEEELLSRSEFPNMIEYVHEKISESIQEMFINAIYHSRTEFIYTCGQFHPARHELNFTIVDTGIGFAKRIEESLDIPNISSKDAIMWAITDGNTSKKDVSGGLGLAILKEFITINKGKMQIISGNAFYELSNNIEKISILHYFFDGSVISMNFNTNDTTTYTFENENEIDLDDIF